MSSAPMETREMSKSTPDLWDIRIRERNLHRGEINPKSLEEYLAKLPDLEAQSEVLDLAQPALIDDGDDDDVPGGDVAS